VRCLGKQVRDSPARLVQIEVGFPLSRTFALISAILFAARLCAADQAGGDPVSSLVRTEMQRQHIPGLTLLVSKSGKPIRAEGYGVSNLELNVAAKPETIFQSGSVGKQFTATVVMMLVEDGKVGLEDPLSKYFPQGPSSWRQVTVRELLSHTAGFTDYPQGFDEQKNYTEDELLKIVEAIPLAFAPGTNWKYSNLGYLTLGILIHRVTGEFYGDFLQQRIFRPLGMTTARIIDEADIIPDRAAGYCLVNGDVKNQTWVSPSLNTTADGSLYFSIVDLAKWDAALYTDRLLKKSSLTQMWTVAPLRNGRPNPGHYGYGWFIESQDGHRLVEHDGAWQGFETQISRYVNDELTVVVLTNLADAKPDLIAHGVARLYLQNAVPPQLSPAH
jgi:CubicO group peptidase (beta-lactamase class C family)